MKLKQISIFLENRAGRLAEVTRVLGEKDINIRALSLADTSDFGILRLIVNQPDEAYSELKANGFAVTTTDVIAVEIEDCPGGLASVLGVLEGQSINVEYMYAFVEKATDRAVVVFRFENVNAAIDALHKGGVSVLSGEKVYAL